MAAHFRGTCGQHRIECAANDSYIADLLQTHTKAQSPLDKPQKSNRILSKSLIIALNLI